MAPSGLNEKFDACVEQQCAAPLAWTTSLPETEARLLIIASVLLALIQGINDTLE